MAAPCLALAGHRRPRAAPALREDVHADIDSIAPGEVIMSLAVKGLPRRDLPD